MLDVTVSVPGNPACSQEPELGTRCPDHRAANIPELGGAPICNRQPLP